MLVRSLAGHQYLAGNLVEAWKLSRRAYMLQPDSPADLSTFAKAWSILGEYDEVRTGFAGSIAETGLNQKVQYIHWLNLMLTGRLERLRGWCEMIAAAGDDPPPIFKRGIQLQLALLALARQDWATAEWNSTKPSNT